MFWPLLVVSGYMFWAVLAIAFCLVTWLSDERFLPSTITGVLLIVAGLIAFTDVPWSWFWHNYLLTLGIAAGYLTFGVAWSFVKWLFLLQDKAADYAKQRDDLKKNYASDPNPTQTYVEWVQRFYGFPPQVLKHKSVLMYWSFFWPASVLRFIFSDFVRKLWDFIYGVFSGLYQKVTDRVFAKFSELKD